MPTGYTRSPKLLKGALIKLGEGFIGPVPNVILFQYNPETLRRDLMPRIAASSVKAGNKNEEEHTAAPADPGEKFSLDLELDASDALEEPEIHPVAVISGVADRIAAIEMLLYPKSQTELGKTLSSAFGNYDPVPRGEVPIVFFFWGPGRILPVRITSFTVDEQAFSPTLFPIRAKVSLGCQVLTDKAFSNVKKTMEEELALIAYKYTRGKKEALARANLINSAESIIGMLPFL